MAKNIVLLSDGTGNSSAKLFKTNVWRLFQALEHDNPDEQVAFYDDGVGTSSNKYIAAITGAVGYGLKRNVLDIYGFLCRNYRPGDRIYGFGFSRGSFTIRVLAGLVTTQGLVDCSTNRDESRLARHALLAYRRYRERFHTSWHVETPFRLLRDFVALKRTPDFDPDKQIRVPEIQFLGLWDTVDAYGGPIEEMTRAIDYWIWPLSMPNLVMSSKIRRACHAMALDDARRAFWPVLWNEREVKDENNKPHPIDGDGWRKITDAELGANDQLPANFTLAEIDQHRLSQVWFTGMHSDVGGGYPQDGLSHNSLKWMMERAVVYGLRLERDERERLAENANLFDKLNDSRQGFGAYYRYQPRKLEMLYAKSARRPWCARIADGTVQRIFGTPPDPLKISVPGDDRGPTIHQSVFRRIKAQTDGYAPIVLPDVYRVAMENGDVLPKFLNFWTDAAQDAPGFLLLLVVLVCLGLWRSEVHATRIGDEMRKLWLPILASGPREVPHPRRLPGGFIFWLRTRRWYRGFFAFLTECLLPTAFGLLIAAMIAYAATVIGSRLLFPTWVIIGQECKASDQTTPVEPSGSTKTPFATKDVCYATGLSVKQGRTYQITLTVVDDWEEHPRLGWISGTWEGIKSTSAVQQLNQIRWINWLGWLDRNEPEVIKTDPLGFGDKASWSLTWRLPFRRYASVNWYQPIVRVGHRGFHEQPLVFTPKPGVPKAFNAEFTAGTTDEVFLYVNDLVSGAWWTESYYEGNHGTAAVTITDITP